MKCIRYKKILVLFCFFVFLLPFIVISQSEPAKVPGSEPIPPLSPGEENIIKLQGTGFGLGNVAELLGLVKCDEEEIGSGVSGKVCEAPDAREILLRLIQYMLGFTALIALIMVIYGGFVWTTAGGNTERVDKGKKILTWALTGLIVLMSAWSIITYIIYVTQEVIL